MVTTIIDVIEFLNAQDIVQDHRYVNIDYIFHVLGRTAVPRYEVEWLKGSGIFNERQRQEWEIARI